MKKQEKVMFLYGKLGPKRRAVLYCSLHKCFISKQDMYRKKFKCEKCIHRKDAEGA